MNEMRGKEQELFFTMFIQELQKELHFQQNGGTSYRTKTAQLSLEAAQKIGSIVPFSDRETAKQTVSQLFPDLNLFRIEDVAKVLHVVARELCLNAALSDEVKAYVQEKRQQRKPLSFLKK